MEPTLANLPVPVPAQETPGNLITAALWNANVYNGFTFAFNRPVFNGMQSTSQSLPAAIWTAINIDTEQIDSYNGHSTTSNTSRYTPQVPGLYLVLSNVGITSVAGSITGFRRARIALNGAVVNGSAVGVSATDASTVTIHTSALVACNGTTDYIETQGTSTQALSTFAGSDLSSSMRVIWISN